MALSTNRTLITQTGINTHQVLNVGGLDSAGIATFSNFKTGSTNVHNIGIEAAGINVLGGDTPIGSGATIYDDGGARFSGVVTATSFVGDITGGGTFTGDISNATGAAAGLGTALSQTQTSPLNKIYFTDNILSIGATITVDPPSSTNVAYTQYAEVSLDQDVDLIIADGDDFIPDVLGLSTVGVTPLTGTGGRVRADFFTNKAGTGAPTFQTGVVITGVATATTFDGALSGNATSATTATNAQGLTGTPNISVGVITATQYVGVPEGTNVLKAMLFV